jgi:hypothetical protein
MLIINESNKHVESLLDKVKKTQNNLYLCSNEKIIKSENKLDTIYNFDKKIIQNKINKIKKIVEKIEIHNCNLVGGNMKYYNQYRKENKKKRKLMNKHYEEIIHNFEKRLKNSPNKIRSMNKKRVKNYKKLI